MSARKTASILIFCLLIPALVVTGYFLTKGREYYLLSLLIIAAAMIPFFLSLERKRLHTRELVITASVVAIAVASRAALFFLPQVKPMCAILIIAAIAFGAEFGFVSGALSILISNFIYGQGLWTPFQMMGMGTTVFLCALILRSFQTKSRWIIGIVSGALSFFVYGILVDSCSVFMMVSKFSLSSVLAVYSSGLPFNFIHGITTGVLTALLQPPVHEKLNRIKTKYGIFGEKA